MEQHHFNPKMLLKNFSNAKEQVWVNDGTQTFYTHIKNVFKIHDLYATWDWSRIPGRRRSRKIVGVRSENLRI